jgi:hypothetical protein
MWLLRLAVAASVFTGQYWNGDPREELGVYMLVLAGLLMAAWCLSEYRSPETPKQRAERYLGSGLQDRAERSLRGRPWEGAVDWDELERGLIDPPRDGSEKR